MAEVTQQPPEPVRTTGCTVVVGDDEDALADPRPAGRGSKVVRGRQRMPPPPLRRQVGELVDPEERRSRNVLGQVRLSPGLDAIERVGAVDELVTDQ
jgi:hypothetical protein